MSTQARPLRREQGLTVQRIGAEVLLYADDRHKAFCLNPTSACLWDLCDGKHTVAELAQAATLALDAAIGEEVVLLALEDFRRDGLLQVSLAPLVHPEVSRRAMMQSLSASAILLLPVVAAVLAPKAAQAYGGCFNCASATQVPNRSAHIQAAITADSQRRAKEKAALSGGALGNR